MTRFSVKFTPPPFQFYLSLRNLSSASSFLFQPPVSLDALLIFLSLKNPSHHLHSQFSSSAVPPASKLPFSLPLFHSLPRFFPLPFFLWLLVPFSLGPYSYPSLALSLSALSPALFCFLLQTSAVPLSAFLLLFQNLLSTSLPLLAALPA